MFGKEGTEQQAAVSTILGNDCKFTGDVEAKGTIRVDGEFDGKIVSSDSVVVGNGGVVKGEMHTNHAMVSGTVEGNIFAKKKVELKSGSRLIGDVESMSLVIEDGVFFEGKSKMRKEGEAFVQKPRVFHNIEEKKSEQPDFKARDKEREKEKEKVKE
jgi:cytoskeletal protein CcmA (bactofilin family)